VSPYNNLKTLFCTGLMLVTPSKFLWFPRWFADDSRVTRSKIKLRWHVMMSFVLILYKVEYQIGLITVCMYKSYYFVYFLYITTKQQPREHPKMKFPPRSFQYGWHKRLVRTCVSISVVSGSDKILILNPFLRITRENLNFLCKIWGFHGGDYEESSLLGCGTV
jgi:hypothetical protein